MFTIIRLFMIILLITNLVGCSLFSPGYVQSRDKEYLAATSIPPLKIPPGIASSAFQSFYPVPYRDYPLDVKDVSIEPPGLDV